MLRAELGEFELSLNNQKTEIVDSPATFFASWRSVLRASPVRHAPADQHDDLLALFDQAAVLAREYPSRPVVQFAVRRLGQVDPAPENWPLMQYLIFQAILAEPDCIRTAMGALYRRHFTDGLPLGLVTLSSVLNRLIERHTPQQSGSEVAWAIWSALVFEIPIEAAVVESAGRLNDPIVALFALDARQRGLISALDTTDWESAMVIGELHAERWLLSYEANVKAWLPSQGSSGHVHSDPDFGALKQWGVHFYESSPYLDRPKPSQKPKPEPEAEQGEGAEVAERVVFPDLPDWALYPF